MEWSVCAVCVCMCVCGCVIVPGVPPQRFNLRIDMGEMVVDYAEIAKKDHLDSLSIEVRKLKDKLRDIHSQQEFQRVRVCVCVSLSPSLFLALSMSFVQSMSMFI